MKNIVKSALKKTKLEGEKGEREEENEIKKVDLGLENEMLFDLV